MVFCDVSGFTALSERLARQGKVGAEELTDVLQRQVAAHDFDFGIGHLMFSHVALYNRHGTAQSADHKPAYQAERVS